MKILKSIEHRLYRGPVTFVTTSSLLGGSVGERWGVLRCACLIPQSTPLSLEWSVSETLQIYNIIWKSLLLKQQDSVMWYGGVTESSRHCYDVFVGLSQLEACKHAHCTLASLCKNTLKWHVFSDLPANQMESNTNNLKLNKKQSIPCTVE